ncbi:MAG: hypothetical protein OXF27_04680, partial [Acidobacteria bacterium]|nr:hypothetical protein [Acidobacteriota bacterium]
MIHRRSIAFPAVLAFVLLAPLAASGQTAVAASAGGESFRTPWGDPDLQGTWTNTTTTPLQRPTDLADKEFLSAEEHAVRDQQVALSVNLDNRYPEGDPEVPTSVGAYNNYWMERGTLSARTSLIVDPPDGRLPPMTPEEEALQSKGNVSTFASSRFDSVKDFNALDRCISRGMPGAMMPGFYNHNYQILQTPDYVVVFVEMVHDAPIIPLDGRPSPPAAVRQWMGDSRGRWEGDLLVVESTSFADKVTGRRELGHTQGGGTVFGGDENLRLVER